MAEGTNDTAASDIPPALTPDDWKRGTYDATETGATLETDVRDGGLWLYITDAIPTGDGTTADAGSKFGSGDLPALIALANAALHDEDPRKLSRANVELLRYVAATLDGVLSDSTSEGPLMRDDDYAAAWRERYSQLLELADVIESYLPPEPVPLPAGANDEPGRESSAASRHRA